MPVLCVDLVPRFAAHGDNPYLLISREGRPVEERGWCWVGGRLWLDERLGEAATRHLRETLGPDVSMTAPGWSEPHAVVEFARCAEHGGPYDPRKHAVSLAWVVDCEGEPRAAGEASSLHRFSSAALPADDEFAFGLGPTIRQLVARDLARRSALP